MKIGIIGIGNVGLSLVQGFSLTEIPGHEILIADKHPDKNKTALYHNDRVLIAADENELIEKSNLILVCIRKDQAITLITDNINTLPKNKVYVFFQAGLSHGEIKEIIDPGIEFYKVITNINLASKIGYSYILNKLPGIHYQSIVEILNALGGVNQIENEEDFNRYSVISGCLPALVAEFVKEVSIYAHRLGMAKPSALDLSKQIIGTTIMNMNIHKLEPEKLIGKVATPGGLTAGAIARLRFERHLPNSVELFFDSIQMAL